MRQGKLLVTRNSQGQRFTRLKERAGPDGVGPGLIKAQCFRRRLMWAGPHEVPDTGKQEQNEKYSGGYIADW